ncbi:MAG TPA: AraC family transcriptional regulator, partial [Planctomycetes bacterium]|nr:AraC family transcriptional regulator [Planctomycetota bacterium]
RQLFDRLPGTMLFAKDERFRIVLGNPAFVTRCGYEREEQLVGLTDREVFPTKLATKYRGDDEQVLRTGKPMFDLIELFPNSSGHPEWSITDKLPLYDKRGKVCGVCGTVRSYELQRAALQPYLELAEVVDHLKHNFQQPLDAAKLAKMAKLSQRQFVRKFNQTFQMSPRAYLMQLRIMHACELLKNTSQPITVIALEAGFYDHADFARHFQRHMDTTATAYRGQVRTGERDA